jgi:nitrogen PTS system EIIA component
MRIVEFLQPDAVIADLGGEATEEVLAELCRPLARHGQDSQELLEILLQREKLGSTGIGDGVAIPHGMFPGTSGLFASFGRSKMGIDFNAIDGKPVRYFFTLFVAKDAAGPHLQALARVSRVFKNPALREHIFDAKDASGIYRLIDGADAKD